MTKAILFDLDGTLLDTTEGLKCCVLWTANKMGFPLPSHEEIMSRFIGPPVQLSFGRYYGLDNVTAQRCADVFRMRYQQPDVLFKATPYPGLFETLDALRTRGIRLGVATYKREDYAIKLLHHVGIDVYCSVAHGGDDLNKRTKSDIIRFCLDELGVAPQDAFLVGDTEHDAEGAMKAGMPFLGALYGFGFKSPADLSRFPHCGSVRMISQILEFVK